MLTINTNLSSLIAIKSLKTSTDLLNQAIERMTTGFKINGAKDDPANYAVTVNMSTKISSYDIVEDNTLMALDMVTTASDTLSLLEDNLQRLRALQQQALNNTYSADTLSMINAECNALIDEINRLYLETEYNGINMFLETTTAADGSKEVLQEVSADLTTTFAELGINASTFSVYDKSNNLISSYDVEGSNTIEDLFTTLSTHGIIGKITTGQIELNSTSENYVAGTLMDELGISTMDKTYVDSTSQTSAAPVTYDSVSTSTTEQEVSITTTTSTTQTNTIWTTTTTSTTQTNTIWETTTTSTTQTQTIWTTTTTPQTVTNTIWATTTTSTTQTNTIWTTTTTPQTVTETIWTTTTTSTTQTNTIWTTTTTPQTVTETIWTTTTTSSTVTDTISTDNTVGIANSSSAAVKYTVTTTATATDSMTLASLGMDGNYSIAGVSFDGSTTVAQLVSSLNSAGINSSFSDGVLTIEGEIKDAITVDEARRVSNVTTFVSGSTYQISTSEDLVALQNLVDSGVNTSGVTFVMTNDIDMNGVNFNGIGRYDSSNDIYRFYGTFDGGGYTISNLNLDATYQYAGLFALISGATVKNVNMTNVNMSSTQNYLGGLVGSANHNSIIDNCHIEGSIIATHEAYIAGIAAYVSNGTVIKNSHFEGEVDANSYAGGIAGIVGISTIENCYANIEIIASADHIGGIAGAIGNNSTVLNCYTTGTVAGSDKVGGIAGSDWVGSSGVIIKNCYESVNGIILGTSSTSSIIDSYKSSSDLTSASTFSSWTSETNDFGDPLWVINDGSMPTLNTGYGIYLSIDATTRNALGLYNSGSNQIKSKIFTYSSSSSTNIISSTKLSTIGVSATQYITVTDSSTNSTKTVITLTTSDTIGSITAKLTNAGITTTLSSGKLSIGASDSAYISGMSDSLKTILKLSSNFSSVKTTNTEVTNTVWQTTTSSTTQTSTIYETTTSSTTTTNTIWETTTTSTTQTSTIYETTTSSTTTTNTIWETTTTSTTQTNTIWETTTTSTTQTNTIWETTTSTTTRTETIYTTTTELATGANTLKDLGLQNNLSLAVYNDGVKSFLTLSNTMTIDEFVAQLNTIGFDAEYTGNKIKIEGTGDSYISDRKLESAFKILYVDKNFANRKVNTSSEYQTYEKNILPELGNIYAPGTINLQIGPNNDEYSKLSVTTAFSLVGYNDFRQIGKNGIDYLERLDSVLNDIMLKQSEYGAIQNRLESVLDSITIQRENLISSRSTLRDADLSVETSNYIQQQILQQASATLLATTNQSPSIALQLI